MKLYMWMCHLFYFHAQSSRDKTQQMVKKMHIKKKTKNKTRTINHFKEPIRNWFLCVDWRSQKFSLTAVLELPLNSLMYVWTFRSLFWKSIPWSSGAVRREYFHRTEIKFFFLCFSGHCSAHQWSLCVKHCSGCLVVCKLIHHIWWGIQIYDELIIDIMFITIIIRLDSRYIHTDFLKLFGLTQLNLETFLSMWLLPSSTWETPNPIKKHPPE